VELQVPFGKKSLRKRTPKSELASQTRGSTAPPPGENQTQAGVLRQAEKQPNSGRSAQSATSTPNRYSRSDQLSFDEDILMRGDEELDAMPSPWATDTTDYLRDAGRGKIRGSNGRFRPKAHDSPASQTSHPFVDVSTPIGGGKGKSQFGPISWNSVPRVLCARQLTGIRTC
jgi:hypothetical protein